MIEHPPIRAPRSGPLLDAPTKAQAAYLAIRREILHGSLAPSSALNQEELATSLGVSTTPLREALRRLESDGLVVMTPHTGVVVAPIDPQAVADLYELKENLEIFAVGLAADRRLEEEAEVIRSTCNATLAASDQAEGWETNRAFHSAIYRSAHNALLTKELDDLWDRYERFIRIVGTLVADRRVTEEHVEIAEAISGRHARTARSHMRAHLRHGADLIARHVADGSLTA